MEFTQPPIRRLMEVLRPGVKQPGHEASQLPPSAAEVKNDRGISTGTPILSSVRKNRGKTLKPQGHNRPHG
jgi:hypothetical protein